MVDITPVDVDDLIPTAEVIRRLRRRQSTISRWVQSGRLRYRFRTPGPRGAMYFDPTVIDKLAAELREEERLKIESFEKTA